MTSRQRIVLASGVVGILFLGVLILLPLWLLGELPGLPSEDPALTPGFFLSKSQIARDSALLIAGYNLPSAGDRLLRVDVDGQTRVSLEPFLFGDTAQWALDLQHPGLPESARGEGEHTLQLSFGSDPEVQAELTYTVLVPLTEALTSRTELPEPPQEDLLRVVEVSDVENLIRAMAPRTRILVRAGTYNLSAATGVSTSNAFWRHSALGANELWVHSVEDMEIVAQGDVEIVSVEGGAWLLTFQDVQRVRLEGLKFVHDPMGMPCQGALRLSRASDIEVTDSQLQGPCKEGFEIDGSERVVLNRSVVRDFTETAVSVPGSFHVQLLDTRFLDNQGSELMSTNGASGLLISGCLFRGNRGRSVGYQAFLFSIDSMSRDVAIMDNTFEDNVQLGFARDLSSVEFRRNVIVPRE